MPISVAASYWQNVVQLFAIIIVFVLILVASYFTTKFVGKSTLVQKRTQNISVLETYKLAQNKYIQIVKIGSKYYALGISKDNISMLSEIEEEQIDVTAMAQANETMSFKEAFEKVSQKMKKKNNK